MSTPRQGEGFAMVTALLFVAVLAVLTGLVALFTVNNARHTRSNVLISKTLAVAQGARNFGAVLLGGPISTALGDEITAEAQAGSIGNGGWTWVFDPNNIKPNATTPDPSVVASKLSYLASNLQARLPSGGCYGPYTLASGEQLLVRATFTGSLPLCDGSGGSSTVKMGYGRFLKGGRGASQEYALPYVMVAAGTTGNAERSLTLSGQYNFSVGPGSFAKYALFTDSEQVLSSGGGQNFFTGAYLFDGPVHTNGNFAFYGNKFDRNVPGTGQPQFYGAVSSAGKTDKGRPGAWFLGSKNGKLRFRGLGKLATPAYGGTKPRFRAGVDWEASAIPLPSNSLNQKSAAKKGGIYVNKGVASLTIFAGDGDGDTLVKGSNGQWQPSGGANAPVYQYITVCKTASKCTRYRVDSNHTLYQQAANDSWANQGAFNGVIYVNGNVRSFGGPKRQPASSSSTDAPPAVAAFSQLNLVSSKDVRVTRDLKYQDPVCDGTLHRGSGGKPVVPTCVSKPNQVQNVLGIYAAGDGGGTAMCTFPSNLARYDSPGNVCIGYVAGNLALTAPHNLEIDASMMAATRVDMENWWSAPVMGTLSIVGGVIARYDGVYGVFSSSNGAQLDGVLPRFTYDQRFGNGLAPPAFPTVKLTTLMSSAQPVIYSQTEQTGY